MRPTTRTYTKIHLILSPIHTPNLVFITRCKLVPQTYITPHISYQKNRTPGLDSTSKEYQRVDYYNSVLGIINILLSWKGEWCAYPINFFKNKCDIYFLCQIPGSGIRIFVKGNFQLIWKENNKIIGKNNYITEQISWNLIPRFQHTYNMNIVCNSYIFNSCSMLS